MIRKVLGITFRAVAQAVFAVIVLPLLYLCEPFYRIRFGVARFQRIGHLALNHDRFLRRQQLFGVPERTFYIFAAHDPANHQLLKMYKRYMNIVESKFLTRLFFAVRPIAQRTRFWEPLKWTNKYKSAGIYELMNTTHKTLEFTPEEEEHARAELKKMGIGEDDWYVPFHAREQAYFHRWRPHMSEHWDEVDFKNCSIENYLKAAEYITERGGFAIRMGAFSEIPLPDTGNPKIIDYATKYRSDFMDIYLCAKCKFFLASSSGLYAVSAVFDVPVAVTNYFAPSGGLYHQYDLMNLRRIRRRSDGKYVTFREAVDQGFFAKNFGASSSDGWDKFDFEENTPEQILDLCKDMFDKLDGKNPPEGATELQERFVKEYLQHQPDGHYISKLGPTFALKNRELLFPE